MPETTIINNPILNLNLGDGVIGVEVERIIRFEGGIEPGLSAWYVRDTDFNAVPGSNYYLSPLTVVNIALPIAPNVGASFALFLKSGGWRITQRGDESLTVHDRTSTVGLGGSVTGMMPGSYTKFIWVPSSAVVGSTYEWLVFPDEAINIY